MSRRYYISEDKEQRILKLYKDGSTIADIARKIDKSVTSIRRVLDKYEVRVSVNRPGLPKQT